MIEMDINWRRTLIPPDATLITAIENLNNTACKLALCIDTEGRLVGTVSDGDLRRGLLRGLTMQDPVSKIVNTRPLVVPEGCGQNVVRDMMRNNKINQAPVVDRARRVVGLYLWDYSDRVLNHDHSMVIMAGGKGTRLRPHTNSLPKPMLPVAGKPILQRIIERAKTQGFANFVLSINYLGEMIREYFGDGSAYGVRVTYIDEDKPLGTVGALSLMHPRPESSFVLTNGDVLTEINYRELIGFCERYNAYGVMAVRKHEWTNPYGVVQIDGMNITGFIEKPVSYSYINAGVYAFSPEIFNYLEPDEHCDIPALFERLREAKLRSVAFPLHEQWLDVGHPADLESANSILGRSTNEPGENL